MSKSCSRPTVILLCAITAPSPTTYAALPWWTTLRTPARASFCYYPCPCGYYGDPVKECTCSLAMVTRYQKRISGPLLDRIDIHVEVPRVEYEKLSDDRLGEPSAAIRGRVAVARERQLRRFEGTKLTCNADMGPAEVRDFCQVDPAGKSLLKAAMQQLQMSARAYHRILKLARTIADLAGSERIETVHLAEAIQYRPRRQS
jgi:magnesium chelatase family protein